VCGDSRIVDIRQRSNLIEDVSPMAMERDIIQVALEAGEELIVHAEGNPAQVVAMGVAAHHSDFLRCHRDFYNFSKSRFDIFSERK